jgi:hypothetical protein
MDADTQDYHCVSKLVCTAVRCLTLIGRPVVRFLAGNLLLEL